MLMDDLVCVEENCLRTPPLGMVVCGPCVGKGKQLVLDVMDILEKFPQVRPKVSGGLRAVSYDKAPCRRRDDGKLPFDLDFVYGGYDADMLVQELLEWASTWMALRDDGLVPSLEYLLEQVEWAMQHQGTSRWPEFKASAVSVRARLIAACQVKPELVGLTCPACHGGLARLWRPRAGTTGLFATSRARRRIGCDGEGLADQVTCLRCRRTWSDLAEATLASIAGRREEAIAAGALVCLRDVPKLYPDMNLRANTLRVWRKRGKLVPRQHVPEVKFSLADIDALLRNSDLESEEDALAA
jgi:hypothetical protein